MRVRIRKPLAGPERQWKYARITRSGRASNRWEDSPRAIRIAVYHESGGGPLVEDVTADSLGQLLGKVAIRVFSLAREQGGQIAHSAIREVVENLIHADCVGATVSILNQGRTVVVSDQGRGILDRDRAVQPGFTTAGTWMRRHIRGVGSGFLVASESMSGIGGRLRLDDNLDSGAVVVLEQPHRDSPASLPGPGSPPDTGVAEDAVTAPQRDLSERRKRVLLILAETERAGPTVVARELDISLATAHRELSSLETLGLVQYVGKGKRAVTSEGLALIRSLFQH